MDVEGNDFGSLLKKYTGQAGIKAERLMSLTQQRFPAIPDWQDGSEKKRCVRAIENWLYRSIKKPNQVQWPLVVAIAAVLSLKKDEAERLLQAGGMKPLATLQQEASDIYQDLFGHWMQPVFAEAVQEDFTEVKTRLGEQTGLIKEIRAQVLSVKSDHLEDRMPIFMVPFVRNPYFTGRDELLAHLDQQLSSAEPIDSMTIHQAALRQPQTIKGLGGIGKTQIAVEYAYRSREIGRYTHTFWIDAANEETIVASFVKIAALIFLLFENEETDQHKLIEAVTDWLEKCEKRWLLIFDNADNLHILSEYLPRRGNGSILLTTRSDADFPLATSIEVEDLSLMEGTKLLLLRARRFDYAVHVLKGDNTNNAAIDEATYHVIDEATQLAITLNQFPLALDQAGAYINETKCSFADYLQMYQEHHKELLARRGLQTTEYPDSVATTWSLSFQRIEKANPAATQLLQLCAFLAPDRIPAELIKDGSVHWPSPLQQAAIDLYTRNQMIEQLLGFSLVKRLTDTEILSIHRMVQTVQRDMMEPEMQRNWAERVVRAVNTVFPDDPQNVVTWSQCLQYLDQAQVCYELIERYGLTFIEGASLLNRTGLYLDNHALYAIAEPLYQHALAITEEQLGPEHPDTAQSLNNLAALYESQGKYTEAERLYQRALMIDINVYGAEHPDVAIDLNNLAGLYRAQGRYTEAEPLLKQALTIKEQCLGSRHPSTATSLHSLAGLYQAQGKYAEAEPLLKRALAIKEQHSGSKHLDTAVSLNNLAALYYDQGKYAKAEPLLKRVLAIYEQQLGSEHPSTATSFNNLAELYRVQGKYVEAEPLLKRALAISEQQAGNGHPSTATSLNNLALLYERQGKYAEAEPLLKRALTIYEQQLGSEHPNIATNLSNLAALYQAQGKYAEAEPLLKRALAIREQQLGSEHPDTAQSLHNLAVLYYNQSQYEQAESLSKRALAICKRALKTKHPLRQSIQQGYHIILEAMKQDEESM